MNAYPYNVYSQQNRARTLLLYLGFTAMRDVRENYNVRKRKRESVKA